MPFMILIGALIFANFVNYNSMPGDLKHFVEQFQTHALAVPAGLHEIAAARMQMPSFVRS